MRWSEAPIPGSAYGTDAPYDALTAEIGTAQQAGWFVTGAYCFSGYHLMVGLAKPADDLDHAEAAYLYEKPHDEYDSSGQRVWLRRIVVVGIAPHHADRGWPKYVPVQLTDTCLAGAGLHASKDETPKINPPPPAEYSYDGPLDEAGKPFMQWDDTNRFVHEIPSSPVSGQSPTPST